MEVSLPGTQLALQAPELLHYLHFGEERPREFRASSTVGHFECSDGKWVMIVGIDQKFWPRIARALVLDHLVEDPRFARGLPRWQNREELQALETAAFRMLTSSEALDKMREADVPASLVQDYAAVAPKEQPAANGYIVEQDHPRFGKQRVVGLHVQLSETRGELSAPAPDLGAHTREVLEEFGIPAEEIDRLARGGVVKLGETSG